MTTDDGQDLLAKLDDEMKSRYYDLDGKSMKFSEWARAFENRKNDMDGEWRIGNDERYGVRVSTVWLGLDHGWGLGPPLIFETMIFGGRHDGWEARYSTREQAIAGHEYACSLAFTTRERIVSILKGFIPVIPLPPVGPWKHKQGVMPLRDAIRGFPE